MIPSLEDIILSNEEASHSYHGIQDIESPVHCLGWTRKERLEKTAEKKSWEKNMDVLKGSGPVTREQKRD